MYKQVSERIGTNQKCEHILLTLNNSIPIPLIINEILTNTFKFALSDQKADKIDIEIKLFPIQRWK